MRKECIECKVEFEFKTHNQKYCSSQCCRVATNKRIMEKYYAKRARLRGEKRLCSCGRRLSMYNPEAICATCFHQNKNNKKDHALEVIKNVSGNSKKTAS